MLCAQRVGQKGFHNFCVPRRSPLLVQGKIPRNTHQRPTPTSCASSTTPGLSSSPSFLLATPPLKMLCADFGAFKYTATAPSCLASKATPTNLEESPRPPWTTLRRPTTGAKIVGWVLCYFPGLFCFFSSFTLCCFDFFDFLPYSLGPVFHWLPR